MFCDDYITYVIDLAQLAANIYLINVLINNAIFNGANKICGYLCILTPYSELPTALITLKNGFSWKESHWLFVVG